MAKSSSKPKTKTKTAAKTKRGPTLTTIMRQEWAARWAAYEKLDARHDATEGKGALWHIRQDAADFAMQAAEQHLEAELASFTEAERAVVMIIVADEFKSSAESLVDLPASDKAAE